MRRITTVLGNRWYMVALGAWFVTWQIHQIYLPKLDFGPAYSHLAYDAILLLIAAACAARWVRLREEGGAWLWIAGAITVWMIGDVYFTLFLFHADPVPVPSPADIGYLAFVPLMLIGVFRLTWRRIQQASRVFWIDGAIAALAIASLGCAIVVSTVVEHANGALPELATNLAYPITDLFLIALTVGAIAAAGWRVDRIKLLLLIGLGVFVVSDSVYLVQVADDTYKSGGILDAGWMTGFYLLAVAAVQRVKVEASTPPVSLRLVAAPLAFAAIGLGLLIYYSTTGPGNTLAIILAAGSLLAVMVRLIFTFREAADILQRSASEAMTDELTGLGNRRALYLALEEGVKSSNNVNPLGFAIFDLDGFKDYNDNFGHPAGDALLIRLAGQFKRYMCDRGQVFRMGGDEFCALFELHTDIAKPVIEGAAKALSVSGEAFTVTCSYGSVLLPLEADEPAEVLRIADRRMYAQKAEGRMSAGRQSGSVLTRALAERDPDLVANNEAVARLAHRTAVQLGLSHERAEIVRQAVALHDVGKIAVPDSVLKKASPLEPEEWEFIYRHTVVGERIIRAAPSLDEVARIVRSSHERWDGDGYPDQVKGHDIPIESRIVAVADAYEAMVSDRPYRLAVVPETALAELKRSAGTQFDPVIVAAFTAAWHSGAIPLGQPEEPVQETPDF